MYMGKWESYYILKISENRKTIKKQKALKINEKEVL
jgi:hypothetical protein